MSNPTDPNFEQQPGQTDSQSEAALTADQLAPVEPEQPAAWSAPTAPVESTPPAEPAAPAAPAAPGFEAPQYAPPVAPAASSYQAPAAPAAPAYVAPAAPAYSAPAAPAYVAPAAPAYSAPAAPAYAAPQQHGQAPAAAPTNTLAIISMISSIVGLLSWGLLSILGVILGHISMKQIKQRGEGGRGMALAGLIVGYVGIGIYALVTIIIVFSIIALAAASNSYTY